MERAIADIRKLAPKSAARAVKDRAKQMIEDFELGYEEGKIHDLVHDVAPDAFAKAATMMLETERKSPRRFIGFGGEVPLINAKATMLMARYLRSKRSLAIAKAARQSKEMEPV
jgi:hypothetical protein